MKNLALSREVAFQFLNDKEIALAGVSRNPKKFGNAVYKTLKSKGIKIYPVNPNVDLIEDEICYRSLNDLPAHVKNLLILLKPSETEKILKEAISRGIKKIWIQQGSENATVVELANEAGITLITGKCVLMYADPTGFHKFHMRLNKLFGKY